MLVFVARDLGFCNGVELAMEKATTTVKEKGEQRVFLYGEIVHNTFVTSRFLSEGAILSTAVDEMGVGDIAVIRAHGITDREREALLARGVRLVDATCPVVLRNQSLVRTSPLPVILFGDPKHAEVLSLVGAARGEVHVVYRKEDYDGLPVGEYRGLVQTTLSQDLLDALMEEGKRRGFLIRLVSSICNASVRRRSGVLELKGQVDAFVVVGDKKSTNTRELVETAASMGIPAYLVDGIDELPSEIMLYDKIGLTAGASTPKELYEEVKRKLESEKI